jgi:hypothetical protein
MASRRRFLQLLAAGVAAFGAGARDLFAQPAAAIRRFLMEGPPGTETAINGRRYLYFGGTSYYTLQYHPEVIKAAHDALDRYGLRPLAAAGSVTPRSTQRSNTWPRGSSARKTPLTWPRGT